MASVIATSFSSILLACKRALTDSVALLNTTQSLVILSARDSVPHFNADYDVVLRPGSFISEAKTYDYAGRTCTKFSRYLIVYPRSRLILDESGHDDIWLTDATLSFLVWEEVIANVLIGFRPQDSQGNLLTYQEIRLSSGTDPVKNAMDQQWGESAITLEVDYLFIQNGTVSTAVGVTLPDGRNFTAFQGPAGPTGPAGPLTIGTTIGSGTNNCVLFVGATGLFADDPNFTYVVGSGVTLTNQAVALTAVDTTGNYIALICQSGSGSAFIGPVGSFTAGDATHAFTSSGPVKISSLTGMGTAATLLAKDSSGNVGALTLGSGLTFSGTTLVGNVGTVTSVSYGVLGNGITGSIANGTSTAQITLGLGAITPTSVAASGTVTGSNLSGTNTGDQTITLTGDVTGTGSSSFSATIAANAVTYAKFQQVAASSLVGNATGSTANVTGITLGIGLAFSGSTLASVAPIPVTVTSATYTVPAGNQVILVDCTSNAITVTLAAVNAGKQHVTIKKIDTSVNALTINPAAGNIDSVSSLTIIGNQLAGYLPSVDLVEDGSNWWVV